MADLKFAAVRNDRKAFLTRAVKRRSFTAAYDALTLDCALACQGLAARLRKVDQVEREMRMAGMHAAREEIFSLARLSKISDETSRMLVREMDRLDARYR